MSLQAGYTRHTFQFNFDARTSRGRMRDKTSWFIRVAEGGVVGMGECGPLPGLSPDDSPEFETHLANLLRAVEGQPMPSDVFGFVHNHIPEEFPAIRFGLETALLDLQHGGGRVIFPNDFVQGTPIPINGLVWMGDLDYMLQQTSIKIQDGFRCIKIKVGSLNFEKECDILEYIRKKYYRENIELRLDANGAFKPEDARYKLQELSRFNIHSIEQPIKAGLPELEELCRTSPIPIALDEELIGVRMHEQAALLARTKPAYIILKPTLHGGIAGCKHWIAEAEKQGIGWWLTSALESNIGLNAISQFAAEYPLTLPQGLGTGMLYENNIPSPLEVKRGELIYNTNLTWSIDSIV